MGDSIRLANWNVEFASPRGKRGSAVQGVLQGLAESAEVICVTEGSSAILPPGYVIMSQQDYGYRAPLARRKVLLWSRMPWTDEDPVGHIGLPPGRFASGTTTTEFGPIRVMGVCIPWRDAHVRSGQANRALWEDHLQYLDHLPLVSEFTRPDLPTFVVGDFNQRIPRQRSPEHVYQRLMDTFSSRFVIATSGPVPGLDRLVIDHIAHTTDFEATAVRGWPGTTEAGLQLSDHSGVEAAFRRAADR